MMAGHWLRYSATLLLCGGVFMGFVAAQTDDSKKPPPKLLQLPRAIEKNATPASVDELRAMEQYTQKIIDKVMPSVVGMRVGQGQGSGVIIDGAGHILTAGHVSGKPGQAAFIVLADGTSSMQKRSGNTRASTAAWSRSNWNSRTIRKSSKIRLSHTSKWANRPNSSRDNGSSPSAIPAASARTARRSSASAESCIADPFVIHTDCTLVGGDSGGPLFDMQGSVIGIHSRIGGFSHHREYPRAGGHLPHNLGQTGQRR